MKIKIEPLFDKPTWTMTYIVYDEASGDAVVIDPVMDYDPASSTYSYDSLEQVEKKLKELDLTVHYILETHAHADHLSGSQELKNRFPEAKVGIGANITKVQEVFKGVFNLKDLKTDGSQFDVLLREGEIIKAGSIEIETMFTPGHTPACATYKIGNNLFTGDALFMPDSGTGRCDFPAGSATDLYESITGKIYSQPDETLIWVGHDYQPGGRELEYCTTVGDEKKSNIQLKGETGKDDFIRFREARDATLSAPRLLLPSVQFNIHAGHMPEAEDNGVAYLKMPFRKKN